MNQEKTMTTNEFNNILEELNITNILGEQVNRHFFEFDDGWLQLCADHLRSAIDAGWNGMLYSAKEKYGELRLYDILPEQYNNCVHDSRVTCEICGQPGSTRILGNWFKTLCDKHYAETIQHNK